MKHTETILEVLGEELARTRAQRDELQARAAEASVPLLQLQSLAEALEAEPEIRAVRGPDFTRTFIPAVLKLIDRLRGEPCVAAAVRAPVPPTTGDTDP